MNQLISKDFESIEKYLNQKIDFHHTEIITNGWANRVYIVNDLVFRFLKFDFLKAQHQVEIDVLTYLEKTSSTFFPQILHFDHSMICYKKMTGVPFINELLLHDKHNAHLHAQDLAHSLLKIHSLPSTVIKCSDYPFGGDHFWEDLWNPLSQKLSQKARECSKKYFSDFFDRVSGVQIPMCILHGDLGSNNILFDRERKRISGLIDFSDVTYGDIARDFNGFYRHHGADFVALMAKYYKGELGDYFWDRVEFYAKRQPWMIYYYADKFEHSEIKSQLIESIEKEYLR